MIAALMVSAGLRISLFAFGLAAAACSSSSPQGAASSLPESPAAAPNDAPPVAEAASPPAATAAPAASSPEAKPESTAQENAKLAAEDIAAGRLSRHPFKYELQSLVAPFVCKKFTPGWSGDAVIAIKDGKVVSFEAGDASKMTKLPELKGKAVPAIPPELAPLFAKPVELDVAC